MPDDDPIRQHPSVVRVTQALATLGVTTQVVVLESHARTAQLAADQLGIEIAQIANSLVFAATGGQSPAWLADGEPYPVLLMTSGAHRVDTDHVAAVLGLTKLGRASADFVRDHAGMAIGGVAPVGHPRPIPTFVDQALAAHDEIWAAGGHPRTVFRTSYDELLRITGGTAIDVN